MDSVTALCRVFPASYLYSRHSGGVSS